jgi:hypothetical protein
VHSDICKHSDGPLSDDLRAFFHAALDEWLDKSDGDGSFWLGNPWINSEAFDD